MFCILLLLSVDLQSGFYQKTITGIHYDILGMHHKQRQIQIMVQGFKLVLSWSVLVGRKKKTFAMPSESELVSAETFGIYWTKNLFKPLNEVRMRIRQSFLCLSLLATPIT